MFGGMDSSPPADLAEVVERFDHVCVAVHFIAASLPLIRLMGGGFRDAGIRSDAGFRWAQFDIPGGAKLELIEPIDPADGDNFLVRFLAHHGEGLHHVTLKVRDIDEALHLATQVGLDVVGVDRSREHWKEAFVHPRSASGVLVQLAEWTDSGPSGRSLGEVIGVEL
jgi:methylmalonyl-CoA/ethylmalonyl-CoA epimerase